jgi:hypothetical protein
MERRRERRAEFEAALASLRREDYDNAALQQAAAVWTIRARNEHASVAAFDRFALGLLAVAAPPQLLVETHEAALDEIEHARISFALASAYSGTPTGPGPLAIDGALEATSLATLVVATIEEACVGETLSAIEAEHAAGIATEPAARVALDIIAADEARHAELAWATVRWALGIDASLEPLMRRAFAGAIERVSRAAPVAACAEPRLEPFGCIDARSRNELFARAIREVLDPAVRAVFGEHPSRDGELVIARCESRP